MDKQNTLIMLQADREYSERQVKQSIQTLRGILDRVEQDIESGDVNANNGLQGNEWRLYKELSNLEMLTKFIKQLEKLNGK